MDSGPQDDGRAVEPEMSSVSALEQGERVVMSSQAWKVSEEPRLCPEEGRSSRAACYEPWRGCASEVPKGLRSHL